MSALSARAPFSFSHPFINSRGEHPQPLHNGGQVLYATDSLIDGRDVHAMQPVIAQRDVFFAPRSHVFLGPPFLGRRDDDDTPSPNGRRDDDDGPVTIGRRDHEEGPIDGRDEYAAMQHLISRDWEPVFVHPLRRDDDASILHLGRRREVVVLSDLGDRRREIPQPGSLPDLGGRDVVYSTESNLLDARRAPLHLHFKRPASHVSRREDGPSHPYLEGRAPLSKRPVNGPVDMSFLRLSRRQEHDLQQKIGERSLSRRGLIYDRDVEGAVYAARAPETALVVADKPVALSWHEARAQALEARGGSLHTITFAPGKQYQHVLN